MSSDDAPPDSTPESAPAAGASSTKSTVQVRRLDPYFTIVPVMTFVVGLLLGALVVALTGVGVRQSAVTAETPGGSTSSTGSAAAPGTPAVSGTPTDVTVTVPGECLQLTQNSQQLVDLVNQAAEAARDLNAARLSSIVNQLQQQQATLTAQTDACRTAAGT